MNHLYDFRNISNTSKILLDKTQLLSIITFLLLLMHLMYLPQKRIQKPVKNLHLRCFIGQRMMTLLSGKIDSNYCVKVFILET